MEDVFLARQPIFDREQNVYAYELLYRSGLQNNYNCTNGDLATSKVLSHSFFSIGIEQVTLGKLAFINFTQNLLLNEVPTIFPKEQVAIEILEDVEPDAPVIAHCEKLNEMGYTLVMDDFVFRPELRKLIDLVDIIKVDIQRMSRDEYSSIIRTVNLPEIKFLAEKVETKEDFQATSDSGYSYFQGYFFAKPDIIVGRDLPAYKMNYLRVLQQVNRPEIDFNELEKIFRQDVSLSYKLLRYINSSYFGLKNEIRSIRHALAMLGLREAKKWLSLIALTCIGKDKSEELVRISLVRANLCELVAPLFGFEQQASELFLMGLFSLIDAFLDKPLAEVLAELPISDDIKKPLLGESSPYQPVYKLVIAYEKGQWDRVFEYLSGHDSAIEQLPELFFKTIERSNLIYPG